MGDISIDIHKNSVNIETQKNEVSIFMPGTQGIRGVGITGVELLSGNHAPGTSDTYRIGFTNGETFDFPVYNGIDGDMSGPASSIVNQIPVFNSTNGKALKASKVSIDDYGYIRGAKIWPDLYDGGFRPQVVIPGLGDTLYYAVERGFTVTSNRALSGGSLQNLFNLTNNSNTWSGVSPANPVVLEITYPSPVYLARIDIVHAWRDSEMNNYTIELYNDNDNNGSYIWETIASVTGNSDYIVSHSFDRWRVTKIKITVTSAGAGGLPGSWTIGTIQAISAVNGKTTGHYAEVGPNTFYGNQTINGNEIISSTSTLVGGTTSTYGLQFVQGGVNFGIGGNSSGIYMQSFNSKPLFINASGNNVLFSGTNTQIGVGTNAPATSALLDLTSTTKGFLPPRMTTVQRDAIATPASGLVIFNTTTNKHQGYNGTIWNDYY